MTEQENYWKAFTLGDLREMIAEIPTNFDEIDVFILTEKEPKSKVALAGLISEKGRVDYNTPKGDELFYIASSLKVKE